MDYPESPEKPDLDSLICDSPNPSSLGSQFFSSSNPSSLDEWPNDFQFPNSPPIDNQGSLLTQPEEKTQDSLDNQENGRDTMVPLYRPHNDTPLLDLNNSYPSPVVGPSLYFPPSAPQTPVVGAVPYFPKDPGAPQTQDISLKVKQQEEKTQTQTLSEQKKQTSPRSKKRKGTSTHTFSKQKKQTSPLRGAPPLPYVPADNTEFKLIDRSGNPIDTLIVRRSGGSDKNRRRFGYFQAIDNRAFAPKSLFWRNNSQDWTVIWVIAGEQKVCKSATWMPKSKNKMKVRLKTEWLRGKTEPEDVLCCKMIFKHTYGYSCSCSFNFQWEQ